MRILNWRLPIFTQFAGLSGQMQSMMPAKQKTALRRSLTAPESGVLQSTGFSLPMKSSLPKQREFVWVAGINQAINSQFGGGKVHLLIW